MAERILIAESGSGYGGTAKYLASLLPLLNRNQFSMEVIAYGDGPFLRQIEKEGQRLYHFPHWRFPWGESEIGRLLAPLRLVGYALLGCIQLIFLIPQIVFWLNRNQIKLVHLNNEIISHLPLVIGARLAGCRLLCHLHGWRSFTLTERWFSHFVDKFIAISEAGAEYFNRQHVNLNVLAIPNGAAVNGQLDGFDQKRERKRRELGLDVETKAVALVGRLVSWKGQEIYLKALAQVICKYPKTVGIVLGHDPTPKQEYLRKLQGIAQELGIAPQIRFLQWQEDVWSIYAASDIVVHASTEPEPFGLVILEAMFARKPVIATRDGGVTDLIVDGQTGYLIEPNHVADLARAMEHLIANPDFADRLAQAGETRAQSCFTMERNAGQVANVYQELLMDLKKKEEQSLITHRHLSQGLKRAIFHTGVVRLMHQAVSFKVPILMYHRISTEIDPFFPAVSQKTFCEQMAYLNRSYRFLSMDELLNYWRADKKVPQRSLAITFDDGDARTWSLVSSILKEFKIPTIVFLATAPIDNHSFIWTDLLRWWLKLTQVDRCMVQINGWRSEWPLRNIEERLQALKEIAAKLKTLENSQRKWAMEQLENQLGVKHSQLPSNGLLDWGQIKIMYRNGVKFGAHTVTHPILTKTGPEEVRYEITQSKRRLEEVLNEKVRHFAYPNGEAGDFNEVHERMVDQAGFDSACSTILGLNDHQSNRYALRRVYASEEPLASFASRLVGLGS